MTGSSTSSLCSWEAKLIDQGRVSATPDGMIDQAELVRVAPYVDTLHERARMKRTPSSRQKRARIKIVCYTDEPKYTDAGVR